MNRLAACLLILGIAVLPAARGDGLHPTAQPAVAQITPAVRDDSGRNPVHPLSGLGSPMRTGQIHQARIVRATRRLTLSRFQSQMLVYAYQIGGYRLAAIILQESSACTRLHGDGGKAHGCGQMHSKTWQYVAGFKAAPWWLDHDPWLAIRAANLYLQECTKEFGEWGGITCYETGAPKARHLSYYELNHSAYLEKVERRITELRQLPLDTE
jgi:hypothetical protein